MKVHNKLKILNDFADSIVAGDKTFVIRENDRGFQKGDFIRFQATDRLGISNHSHLINNKLYEITYVLNEWGIKNGYVALAIKEVE